MVENEERIEHMGVAETNRCNGMMQEHMQHDLVEFSDSLEARVLRKIGTSDEM